MVTAEAGQVHTNQFVIDLCKLCKLDFRCLTYIVMVHRDIRTASKYFKHKSDIIRVIVEEKRVILIAV